jgi:predicted lipoprotein with Yx(FWY)xxD motif
MKKILLALAIVALFAAPVMAAEYGSSSTSTKSETTTTTHSPSASTSAAAPSAPATTSTTASGTTAPAKASSTAMASNTDMPAGIKKSSCGSKGDCFTTASGMTLYTYAKDTAGKPSTCTGECSKNWMAAKATASDKPTGFFTIISGQLAYNDKPLYTYSKDTKAGEMMGANIPSWSVATVSPAMPEQSPAH